MKYRHVAEAVLGQPWMVRPETLQVIADLVHYRMEGGKLTDAEIAARIDAGVAAAGPRGGGRAVGAVGIIPVYGLIIPRANLMSEFSGGTSVAAIRTAFRQALDDETVGSILLEFDSPGGQVDGIEELATEIRDVRGRKPIVAIANTLMASAAYYLGSQADEVVASPSSQVGWIGTVRVHREVSRMAEEAGITTTIFRNPPDKYGGNEYEPLSDQARTELQQSVDDYSAQFVAAVSRGRGVPPATVRSDYGRGGGMTAARAKASGLVDRVDTLDGTIRRMATGKIEWPRQSGRALAAAAVEAGAVGETDQQRIDWLLSDPGLNGQLIGAATLTVHEDGSAEMTDVVGDVQLGTTEGEPDAPDDREALELLTIKHRARSR